MFEPMAGLAAKRRHHYAMAEMEAASKGFFHPMYSIGEDDPAWHELAPTGQQPTNHAKPGRLEVLFNLLVILLMIALAYPALSFGKTLAGAFFSCL